MEQRIGISGWRYEPWRGVFYPKDLIQKEELAFASRQLNSIEINGTFYSMQLPQSFKNWFAATPENFCFSVKGPRYITHIRRLKDVREPLENFFASGVLHLGKKLGPFLWQFPPNFLFDDERLEEFFKLLPKTHGEAAKLAKGAQRLLPDFPKEAIRSNIKIRHAIEIRHHSFENPDFIALLRKYKVALVFADTAGIWPYIEDLTSDFVYVRLHGEKEIYSSGYPEESLQFWAERLRRWQSGRRPTDEVSISDEAPPALKSRDFYVYFDNDIKVKAPFDARRLAEILGL